MIFQGRAGEPWENKSFPVIGMKEMIDDRCGSDARRLYFIEEVLYSKNVSLETSSQNRKKLKNEEKKNAFSQK